MAIPAIIANVVNALYKYRWPKFFIGQGGRVSWKCSYKYCFSNYNHLYGDWFNGRIGAASNFNLALGRKEDKHAREVAGTAVVLLVTAGLMIMSVVLLFLQPLLNLFGATDQILGYASEYAGITAFGIPFFMISIGFNPLVRADGRATYSMMAIIVGALLNTILDPLFILGLIWGLQELRGQRWSVKLFQQSYYLRIYQDLDSFDLNVAIFKLSFEDVKVLHLLG